MKHVVITLVGQDKSGIVEKISRAIFSHQGNWLASSLSKMAGQFAGIVQATIPEEQVTSLQQALNRIDGLQCLLQIDEWQDNSEDIQKVSISVVGNDKPGIVQEVSAAISHAGASVIKMQTSCDSAPNWGGELFKAELLVNMPEGIEPADIQQTLEAIANDLMVELRVE